MRKKVTLLLAGLCCGVILSARETEQLKAFLKHISRQKDTPVRELLRPAQNNWFFEGKYRIVFANERYFSFQAEELTQKGTAGKARITVGSVLRSTGRTLKLRNVLVPREREKVLQQVREQLAAHFKCPAAKLPGFLTRPLFLTENFYLDNLGIHLVYNAGEIAREKEGILSLVVPFNHFSLAEGLK